MARRILAYLVSALLIVSPAMGEPKTLIVSIDGCRPDALQIVHPPNVTALIAAGSVSYDARNTLQYGESGPNYSSMLTGTWLNHGVTSNNYDANGFLGNHFDLWPHMFKRLEASDPSLYTAQFCGWGPINGGTWADRYADEVGALGDSGNANRIAALLTTGDPDVIFWQISAVDSAGHSAGFSPTSPAYLSSITTADTYLGTVLAALRSRPGYVNGTEDWLILTVTDHGGYGTSHHLPAPGHELEIQKTFYIATGRDVMAGMSLGQPRVYDVAVTTMAHMGLDVGSMNLDGLVVPPEPTTRWRLDLGGNASTPTNWTAGVPNGVGQAANFTDAIKAPRQVTVDVPTTLGSMLFDNVNAYTIAGPGDITLQAGSGHAEINITSLSGPHVISAPVRLLSPLDIDNESAGALTLAGPIDNAAGLTIVKIGPGAVDFDGPQTYGPGSWLNVFDGMVNLGSDAGSASDANLSILVTGAVVSFECNQHLDTLSIGDGGKAVFAGADVVVLKHLVMGGIDFGATTLTPEPATLSLLALGGLALMRRRKRRG